VFESVTSRSDGVIDVGGIGFSHLADDLSGGGVDSGKRLPGRAIYPLVIDEQFGR
jgi:hypothetical protein